VIGVGAYRGGKFLAGLGRGTRKLKNLCTVLFAALLFVSHPVTAGEKPIYTSFFNNLAISGYDSVAYFTEGKPIKGKAAFATKWKGAEWRFANAENLAAFKADPAAYAPQYGGYCAWGMAQGYTASAEPDIWRIVDGKLYLNYSKSVQQQWVQDIQSNIAKADKKVSKVLAM